MRVIIAGSRTITDYALLERAIELAKGVGIEPTLVLSGCASGVDELGERWADLHGVPVEKYPAHWDRFGARAGPMRNRVMVGLADALIAVWDGKSPGTRDMIDKAYAKKLKVYWARESDLQ